MAHKKASGTTKNGRDSHSKRLGIKHFGGEYIKSGSIIIKQRGTKFHAGYNVKCGKDYTLYAIKSGTIFFSKKGKNKKKFINIKI